jgi:hypothetical protein
VSVTSHASATTTSTSGSISSKTAAKKPTQASDYYHHAIYVGQVFSANQEFRIRSKTAEATINSYIGLKNIDEPYTKHYNAIRTLRVLLR